MRYCLDGRQWPRELLHGLVDECSEEFFRIVVERLADLFEPRLCDTYAELFSEAIAHVQPDIEADKLVERYRRVRRARSCRVEPANVFVLSRVTLGADIAVTSIILEAAKFRFPCARIHFVGGLKSAELFADDSRIHHLPVHYPRGASLRERLAPWKELEALLSAPDSIVIDPDSRLTQLGLLPVCPEENYFFFESRSYGGDGDEDLSTLTRRWVSEVFGVAVQGPAISVHRNHAVQGCTVSLGTGGNPAKGIGDPFEAELLACLAQYQGEAVDIIRIDKGAGGEEASRVDRAIALSGVPRDRVRLWEGSFAGFASIVARSKLYVGYDSAGQHAAAACGIPLVTIFAGYPSERMFARWRPTGTGPIEIVKVDHPDPRSVLAQVKKSLDSLKI